MHSENVAGTPSQICWTTLRSLAYDVSWPVKICFIIVRYCTGSGLSRPRSAFTRAINAGSAFLPAILAAGSELGITLKIKNTITEMANSTATIPSSRLATKRVISSVLQPDLRARIHRVAQTISEDVERQHRRDDHQAGHDGEVRRREDHLIAVGDHGAPRCVGWSHACTQE